jgi:hypothetical protein
LKSAKRSGIGGDASSRRASLPQQVVDQDLRVHFLLDVERRRLHDQVGPVLLVLAAPDELRVEIAVAPLILFADWRLVLLVHDRFELGRRDIAPLVLVAQRLDRDFTLWHVLRFPFEASAAAISRVARDWPRASAQPERR